MMMDNFKLGSSPALLHETAQHTGGAHTSHSNGGGGAGGAPTEHHTLIMGALNIWYSGPHRPTNDQRWSSKMFRKFRMRAMWLMRRRAWVGRVRCGVVCEAWC